MRKNVLFKISAYILSAAVFAGGGAWVGASFAGTGSTGVLPESAGGTGATNYSAALALKAPLASPAFTGTPSLPTGTTGITQTALNNSTKLATTAYTDSAVTASQTTSTTSVSALGVTAVFYKSGKHVSINIGGANSSTSLAAGTTLLTVPTGYRPPSPVYGLARYGSTDAYIGGYYTIDTNGALTFSMNFAGNARMILSGSWVIS